jgi:hypothetical protein
MSGIDDAFWDKLDARIAAPLVRAPARLRSPVTAPRTPDARPRPAEATGPEGHRIADWTGLVDTISAAGAAAHEQSVAYESLAEDLRRALAEVEMYKALIARTQAQALTQAREIQAMADARVEALQARADARVQQAEERAEVADLRAGVVEEWLAKFEQASRDLLPSARKAEGRPFNGSAAA